MAEVTWRAHPVHPGYEASSDGRFRSVPREVLCRNGHTRSYQGRELAIVNRGDNGYLGVTVCVKNKAMSLYVHRLVCESFYGLQPNPKSEVRHLNGDKSDNRVENLRWGTRSENQIDNVRHGVNPRTKQTHCIHGHEFTPENTYFRTVDPPHRQCRQCTRDSHARRRRALSTQMRQRVESL